MSTLSNYLAVIEIDERPANPQRMLELEAMFEAFDPAVTATPRGRVAVRLHLEAESLPQAALQSVAAVTHATHADAVALAVLPETDAIERSSAPRRVIWGVDTTWLDDL